MPRSEDDHDSPAGGRDGDAGDDGGGTGERASHRDGSGTPRRTFLKGSAAALGAGAMPAATAQSDGDDDAGEQQVATTRSSEWMVSTVHPQATQVGADVLDDGGNAVDAAVAVQFALNVVQPHSSGIGGGGFTLVYVAAEDELYAIDNRERAPMGADPGMFLDENGEVVPFEERHTNGKAVGVPGTLRAAEVAVKRFGTRPLSELVAPAVELAAPGAPAVTVDATLADAIQANVDDGTLTGETMSVFAPGGRPLQEGDTLVQEDLGATLRLIQGGGSEAFYQGEIADDIAETVRRADRSREEGGSMTVDDLGRYNVELTQPEYATYEGEAATITVRTMSMPSSGGLTIGQILGLLEGFDLASHGRGSFETYHRMIEAFHLAFADRGAYLGDREFVDLPWQGFLDEEYVAGRRELIRPDAANPATREPGDPYDYQPGGPYRVDPREPCPPGLAAPTADSSAGPPAARAFADRGQTTHFTTADADGNVVSWTSTIEQLFGSGIMVPGRGFMLNNELTDFSAEPGGPNEVQPEKRPLSSTSPTVVFRDGEPFMTVGSPGGPTIITTVAKILVDVAEFGTDLPAAVRAPRVYAATDPTVLVEPGVPEGVREDLADAGHELEVLDGPELGSVQAIMVADGEYLGVGDFRRESAVEGG